MSVEGTDISSWQLGDPNFAGDVFDFVKATEGVGWESPTWATQVDSSRAKGLLAGDYHFCNGNNPPEEEADYFCSVIKQKWQVGDPTGADTEGSFFQSAAASDPVGWMVRWHQRHFQNMGFWALQYLDYAHLHGGWDWSPVFNLGCGLWGAAYNGVGFGDPSPWPFVSIWQDKNTNVSGGDDDIFYGTVAQLRAYGTPQGGDVALTQSDVDAVVNGFLNKLILRQGVDPAAFASPNTTPGAVIAWSDSNDLNIINRINAHIDEVLKALPTPQITLTDAQVASLVPALVAALKQDLLPAQITLLGNQLLKP